MTTKDHLLCTLIVSAALMLAVTAVWLSVAAKVERDKLGFDRIGLTILVDGAAR